MTGRVSSVQGEKEITIGRFNGNGPF